MSRNEGNELELAQKATFENLMKATHSPFSNFATHTHVLSLSLSLSLNIYMIAIFYKQFGKFIGLSEAYL
jgi:hypothetical protein